MPHKKNPIRSERIAGLARVIRGYVTPVTEGIPLWHERDISHSSVERIALPDAAIATDYVLHLTTGLVEGLTVDAARMRANLDATGGLIYSSRGAARAGQRRDDPRGRVRPGAGGGHGHLGPRHAVPRHPAQAGGDARAAASPRNGWTSHSAQSGTQPDLPRYSSASPG